MIIEESRSVPRLFTAQVPLHELKSCVGRCQFPVQYVADRVGDGHADMQFQGKLMHGEGRLDAFGDHTDFFCHLFKRASLPETEAYLPVA